MERAPESLDEIGRRFEVRWAEAHSRGRPDDLEALRVLAYLYSSQGRHEDALREDLRLVAAAPERADLHYDLACSQALLGRKDDAFASLERAVALGFGDPALLDEDDDLASLRADPRWAPLRARVASA
jgi:Flp pilus assembly protein TadD